VQPPARVCPALLSHLAARAAPAPCGPPADPATAPEQPTSTSAVDAADPDGDGLTADGLPVGVALANPGGLGPSSTASRVGTAAPASSDGGASPAAPAGAAPSTAAAAGREVRSGVVALAALVALALGM